MLVTVKARTRQTAAKASFTNARLSLIFHKPSISSQCCHLLLRRGQTASITHPKTKVLQGSRQCLKLQPIQSQATGSWGSHVCWWEGRNINTFRGDRNFFLLKRPTKLQHRSCMHRSPTLSTLNLTPDIKSVPFGASLDAWDMRTRLTAGASLYKEPRPA